MNNNQSIKERMAVLSVEGKEMAEQEKMQSKKDAIVFARVVLIVSLVVAVFLFVTHIFIPNRQRAEQYDYGIALLESGEFEKAYDVFLGLGEYHDSASKAEEALFCRNIEELKACKVGDYVRFGTFQKGADVAGLGGEVQWVVQDIDSTARRVDMEWLVLDIQEGKALLISKDVLYLQSYYDSRYVKGDLPKGWPGGNAYEFSTIRSYLNEGFLDYAFSPKEQRLIDWDEVEPHENPEYATSQGRRFYDKVFLLSVEEANKYFSTDAQRQVKVCPDIIVDSNVRFHYSQTIDNDNNTTWWLRTMGENIGSPVYVDFSGDIVERGMMDYKSHGIRPAMWVFLNR